MADMLSVLKEVSETLARWQNNDGPLAINRLSNDEEHELDRLEFMVEEAIIERDEDWLP